MGPTHSTTAAVVLLLLLLSRSSHSYSFPQTILQTTPHPSLLSSGLSSSSDDLFCDSWRFSEETNDAGPWAHIPARCAHYVAAYMTGDRYRSDSEAVSEFERTFAAKVDVSGDGGDAWVFDVDETLLSNLPYYVEHGFGSEAFDETSFDEWVDLANAPALPASLNLYNELQKLGFSVFLLTGRGEHQRNVTEKNLLSAGFKNWKRLILRGPSDLGKPAVVYKSEKRKELENEGYIIHGCSGDQWSDLNGFSVATRSFKLPNPMYYIA